MATSKTLSRVLYCLPGAYGAKYGYDNCNWGATEFERAVNDKERDLKRELQMKWYRSDYKVRSAYDSDFETAVKDLPAWARPKDDAALFSSSSSSSGDGKPAKWDALTTDRIVCGALMGMAHLYPGVNLYFLWQHFARAEALAKGRPELEVQQHMPWRELLA